jgi:hypothetical protein
VIVILHFNHVHLFISYSWVQILICSLNTPKIHICYLISYIYAHTRTAYFDDYLHTSVQYLYIQQYTAIIEGDRQEKDSIKFMRVV